MTGLGVVAFEKCEAPLSTSCTVASHTAQPHVQDFLSGLAADAGCQLEAQLGLSAGMPTCGPSMWLWLFIA